MAPEKRTIASAPVPLGVQHRAGSPDAALDAPVAGALIYRPFRANANPGVVFSAIMIRYDHAGFFIYTGGKIFAWSRQVR
jgi:hypothetical protein